MENSHNAGCEVLVFSAKVLIRGNRLNQKCYNLKCLDEVRNSDWEVLSASNKVYHVHLFLEDAEKLQGVMCTCAYGRYAESMANCSHTAAVLKRIGSWTDAEMRKGIPLTELPSRSIVQGN